MKRWTGLILSGALLAAAFIGGAAEARSTTPGAEIAAAGNDSAAQDAERAVLQAPGDAARRALLGRAYLEAGRFASAETAFGDAFTLDPSLGGAAVKRALAQIALGRETAARETLTAARGKAADADVGLAMALAGQRDDAIALLETAARRADADARTRQNLALAYAFEGRWTDAAATAARDVPADHMADRLRRWALIIQHGPRAADQVMALLGVTAVADPGQPMSLALATPAAQAPAVAIRTTELTPAAVQIAAPVVHVAVPAPVKPLMAMRPKRASGNFVVQLGAYYSPAAIQTAWKRLSGNASYLHAYKPAGSRVPARLHGASLYRLSLSGFTRHADAARICRRIRANGGSCFVRATSGDRPIIWAKAGRDQSRA